jgi:site-specific DNA-methyltransferase (adenine-specific)
MIIRKSKPLYQDDWVTIYHGDSRALFPRVVPTNSIDMILTDPPYYEKFLWAFDLLGEQGARSLVEGGSLVSLCGQVQIPYIIKNMGKHLRYWWMAGMRQDGHTVLPGKWVGVQHKPAIWYVKNKRRADIRFPPPQDMLKGGRRRQKSRHKWEQPVLWFRHWIHCLTKPGETVLDPFVGSGTVLVAAKKLGRKAIGIESDRKTCLEAAQRISETKADVRGFIERVDDRRRGFGLRPRYSIRKKTK